ncbi:hypothetical protein ABZW10_29850 [Kitasatospora sp. NPDC004723]|uniref:hypothetical protein n=1 Tax=Kitasatospora sp. NPDC004723 TaxID=3154288 RepID=UPI0033BF0C48
MESLRHELTRFIQQPAAQQDPPALHRRLLAEAPVLDLGRLYVVSGYEEILTVLTHPGAAVDPAAVGLPRAGSTALAEVVTRMLPMRLAASAALTHGVTPGQRRGRPRRRRDARARSPTGRTGRKAL